MKKFYCILVLLSGLTSAQAQDPNFSQFFASPLTMNPALTGKFEGTYRVAGNYRNQWPTIYNAYTTYTASFDAGIMKTRIPEVDQFGVGIMAFSDKAGDGILQNNFIALSTSYHKGLDEDGYHQLGVGFQGTYVNKRLNLHNSKFEDQLTSQGFTGTTDEHFSNLQLGVSYFDMNAGLFYTGTTNGANNLYFGASMYHINQHKETFNAGEYYLKPRMTLQAGGRLPMGELNSIHISTNYSRQAHSTSTTIGGAYALNLNADETTPTNLYLGTWMRLGDAIIPYIGLEFNEFHIGATYDVNFSKLKPGSNMRGGAEFSLIYTRQARDPNMKKLYCPKF